MAKEEEEEEEEIKMEEESEETETEEEFKKEAEKEETAKKSKTEIWTESLEIIGSSTERTTAKVIFKINLDDKNLGNQKLN